MNGRKLRPLVPRPPNSQLSTYSSVANPFYISTLHKSEFLSSNDHLEKLSTNPRDNAANHEQCSPEISMAPLVTSSRWNPTPEQLRVLEELYDGGTRTPTADQIKQIAGRLRTFGNIEGKNVFYWFQNHKARERQKRRRDHTESLERVQQDFEVGQGKNKATSKCITISEDSVSIHGAVASESRTDEWIQLDEWELQQRRRRITQSKHSTWKLMKPSSTQVQLIMDSTSTLQEALNLSMAFLPNCGDMNVTKFEEENAKPQTLQLFPMRSSDRSLKKGENEVSMAPEDTTFPPNKFYEFFPLKN